MERVDVCVRGGGAVGSSLALALARQGFDVALAQRTTAPAGDDVRAYALGPPAVALLQQLRVWDSLPADAVTPVEAMRIDGDQGPGGPAGAGAAAPGHLEFSAWQQRVAALAWIVDAAALEEVLAAAVRFAPKVRQVQAPVPAALQAVCEGRDSSTRAELGVAFERHPYGHSALAARLVSDRPHQGLARQWFRSPDVLALLPFDRPQVQHSYALVWSLPQEQANAWQQADTGAFEAALNAATGGAAGTLRLASRLSSWPLALGRASRWCGPGWVLVGDAAHVVHPLAGQGLNLGLADVAALVDVLTVVRRTAPWRPLGDERTLRRYARHRLAPTLAMGLVTDGLLQLFAQPASPVRELRNRGLTLVNHVPLLKRWLAGRALQG
jgi:2-polyprenyl-6-methoxyphenol hydroxylase-like FAD-dependent oxidoreductase